MLLVDARGDLLQLGYGARRASDEVSALAARDPFHPAAGNGFVAEPALQVVHADGNTSTDLSYLRHETAALPGDRNVVRTRITLKDRYYPLNVDLVFEAYRHEDVIRQWVEIVHQEDQPVTLTRFASSAPVVHAESYWLSQFQGAYMREMELVEEELHPGIKILDSKLGVRAHQTRWPSFLLALDHPADETSGEVLGGSLAWSGSFQLAFEVDADHALRMLAGINPFGAAYRLASGRVFTTPGMLWTYSDAGKGQLSRNFHRWARRYGIRDADKPRPILLNNWEATHFDFDEAKIVALFDGARALGAELFLLDDGWFGNRFPRDDDRAGLGDWAVNRRKLPHGLSYLADAARGRQLGFGIWLEPEMVNPSSELYQQHPDWVITQPHREPQLSRNQLVLDLTRPEVQEHVWQTIARTLGDNPGIRYVKWDANRFVTQPGSSFLPAPEQQNLLVDYQWALYRLMERMAKTFPGVMAMVCAGGSGRVDYGALRHFHGFWPSDNTDPVQRLFIQWGFGHFFPASAISAHVTDMGRKPIKLAVDVALSGAFGIDRDVTKMSPEERTTVAAAAKLYRETLSDLVGKGDLYRLESPYQHPRSVLSYVSARRDRAALYVYQLRETAQGPIRPRGIDPGRRYRVREVNLPEGRRSRLAIDGQLIGGAALMADGFRSPLRRPLESAIILLTAE